MISTPLNVNYFSIKLPDVHRHGSNNQHQSFSNTSIHLSTVSRQQGSSDV